eukprot:31047-Pelagococcus_subviridis.AAC.5
MAICNARAAAVNAWTSASDLGVGTASSGSKKNSASWSSPAVGSATASFNDAASAVILFAVAVAASTMPSAAAFASSSIVSFFRGAFGSFSPSSSSMSSASVFSRGGGSHAHAVITTFASSPAASSARRANPATDTRSTATVDGNPPVAPACERMSGWS